MPAAMPVGSRAAPGPSRRVALTPAGEAFLPATRACPDSAGRAAADAAAATGEIRGRLVAGVIPAVTGIDLPAALHAYRRSHPRVRIVVRTGSSDDLAFAAAGLTREVAFEAMATDLFIGLVRQNLAVALLPSRFVTGIPGLVTMPVDSGPGRIEYLAWSDFDPTPAATAFLEQLAQPMR